MPHYKFSIEFPSNKMSEIEYIADAIKDQKDFCAIVVIDPPWAEEHFTDDLFNLYSAKRVYVSVGEENIYRDGRPSMEMLRRHAFTAAEFSATDWSIMTDGDLEYRKGAFDFIRETAQILDPLTDLHRPLCNLRGHFGSNHSLDNVVVAQNWPLGTNNGFLVHKSARRAYLENPPPYTLGGCEDPMMASWLALVCKCTPLYRFRSPIVHRKKSTEHYGQSFIHDKSVHKENAFKVMRELWDEKYDSLGFKKSSVLWGGIPDNFDQSGKMTPEGRLSPYYPRAKKVIGALIGGFEIDRINDVLACRKSEVQKLK